MWIRPKYTACRLRYFYISTMQFVSQFFVTFIDNAQLYCSTLIHIVLLLYLYIFSTCNPDHSNRDGPYLKYFKSLSFYILYICICGLGFVKCVTGSSLVSMLLQRSNSEIWRGNQQQDSPSSGSSLVRMLLQRSSSEMWRGNQQQDSPVRRPLRSLTTTFVSLRMV
jgi:hypothetical protein